MKNGFLIIYASLITCGGATNLAAQTNSPPLRCVSQDEKILTPDVKYGNSENGYQSETKLVWRSVRMVTCTAWNDIVQIGTIEGNRGNCKLTFDEGQQHTSKRFGDTIKFYAESCKLIEYRIEVDGRLRTYTVNYNN